ncbi:hypothetical protein ACFX11_038375 [Malus domestica]
MTYVLFAMFCTEPGQPATVEGDYLVIEPRITHANVEETGKRKSNQTCLPKLLRKEPEKVYFDRMVFNRPSMSLANPLKPIYVNTHLEEVPFKRVLIDRGAAVNIIPSQAHIPTDLTVSSFSGAITRTHRIIPLEVDLGSKKIMLALFVVDSSSNYGALLGRDWIHQSLSVPSIPHQQITVYHEAKTKEPGFWEMVEVESWPFLPTNNVAEANFYNPNIGILQCLGADENDRPTKVIAPKLLE